MGVSFRLLTLWGLLSLLAACGQVWQGPDQKKETTEIGCGPQLCERGARLRGAYLGPIETWPAVQTTNDTPFAEMAILERREVDRVDPLVGLGEDLFFDPILSQSGQFACASCHHPDLAFTDGIRVSVGAGRQSGRRNAPTLLDKADQPVFMWDGSALSFEEQALMPIANPVEMASDHVIIADLVSDNDAYSARFQEITGRGQVTIEDIAAALGAYQRTLGRRTKFDRFLEGERYILTDQELLGLHLFRTKAGCMTCHSGPRLTDDEFHNLGLHFYGRSGEDLGRYVITGDPADVGAFRTPSLRHIRRTGPYMHNGLIPTLRGVVNLYDEGGAHPRPRAEFADDPLFPETSPLLPELGLTTEEKTALIAYLETL